MADLDGYKKKYYEIQELERQRIARELHDSSLQNLTHIIQQLELASLYMDNDIINAKLEMAAATKELRGVIQDIRNTIFDLRPMTIDDLGMKETLIRLIDNMNRKYQINISYQIERITEVEKEVFLDTYRVIQEFLLNAIKHASADNITLIVKNNQDEIWVQITDDGKGFEYSKYQQKKNEHFGIGMAKERISLHKGNMIFNSIVNKGTDITIQIPKK